VSTQRSVIDMRRTPAGADDAIALEFSRRYGGDLRFTAAWGRWNQWNGTSWERDDTLDVFDMVRQLCREVSSSCGDEKLGRRIGSASTVAAVERLVRADRRHAATVDQWDADPWLLNTPGGTVDLRTRVLRAASRDDYCTKTTDATPGGECPLWMDFLSRVTDRNVGLHEFLQRLCGYSLTGITREHALFFLYGTGANGKSVFINTISGVMGDYAKTAPIETFTASVTEQHPTDLAGLRGSRLVTTTEIEDGKRWAESKLKRITGGDKVPARFMRQDFFEFTPQFKLLIAGNHKPGIRAVDEAMRRRIHLVPFTVTIPVGERDEELTEKLRAEWGGILRWAIDGCSAWQRQGLNPPAIVRDATEEYLAAEDAIGTWLEERCDIEPTYSSTVADLYASWRGWCDQNGEPVCSRKRFSQNLDTRGFARERSPGARRFRGLALKEGCGI
jgi:putative DNA primase/helicase